MEEFKGDKRTKAYKEWKKKFELEQSTKSEGLGDDVKKVLDSDVVKPIVDVVKKALWKDGEDCGCDERQEKLNKLAPRRKMNCLTEEQFVFLTEDKANGGKSLTREGANMMVDIHNHVFNMKNKHTSCGRCIKNMRKQLYKVLDAYGE